MRLPVQREPLLLSMKTAQGFETGFPPSIAAAGWPGASTAAPTEASKTAMLSGIFRLIRFISSLDSPWSVLPDRKSNTAQSSGQVLRLRARVNVGCLEPTADCPESAAHRWQVEDESQCADRPDTDGGAARWGGEGVAGPPD